MLFECKINYFFVVNRIFEKIQRIIMKNFVLLSLLALLFLSNSIYGQKIHHELSMPAPETHYFHVETILKDFVEEKIVLTMPVWSPGSYLVREYPKNVNLLRAKDEKGKNLPVKKITKNQWEIEKGKAKTVTVNYEVYAFELTVRTSFLDLTHGFLNGVNIFMYPEGHKDLGGKLTVVPHSSFKTISAPLEEEKEGFSSDDNAKTFIFNDFDELADSPIEIGNQEVFHFTAAGVEHEVAMYGPGNYNVEQLKIDMAKIVESATAIFGQNPNKKYLFIIHNTHERGGGLEHMNSTTLSVNRWTYSPENYMSFLSLVAHEYFHVWMVKRLRPSVLVDYDYSNENYTDLLWVMEGFTSYYDKLLLRRAGFYTEGEYVNRFTGLVNWVERTIGNQVQPVADASFDAWIKAYRPNENSSNTTISYYSKGGLIATVFDAMIIEKSKGKKSLDDFMQKLYHDFYEKENIGITEESFKKTLQQFVDEDLDEFFKKYINGTETIPYDKYLKPLGIKTSLYNNTVSNLGISTEFKDGLLTITSVKSGGSGEKAGLSPNDEIIAFNGFRVDKEDFDKFTSDLTEGDELNLIISRDKQLMSVDVEIISTKTVTYNFTFDGENKLGKYWLRVK